MTIDDYRNERLRKLAEIKNLGIDPYPAKSFRTHKIGDIIANFGKLENQTVTLAGRISAIRSFGKLAFVKIKDMSGEIQIFMKDVANLPSETVSRNSHENFEASEPRNDGSERTGLKKENLNIRDLKLLDSGDFVEANPAPANSQFSPTHFASSANL